LIRQKRNIKTIFVISIFVFLIFLANLTPISDLNLNSNDNFISDNPINYESESPNSASLNLTEFITGQGTNQTVRLCMENSSNSINNQNGYFEIPSPANNMSLSSGDFLFNFNNNFTTNYIIEDDNALYSYYDKFRLSSTSSYMKVNNGTEYPSNGFKNLITNPSSSPPFNISSKNGLANFTICANFNGVTGSRGQVFSSIIRESILGFILNFTYRVSKDANVTVYMKDFYDTKSFKNITNTFKVSTSSSNNLNRTIVNENLNYINISDCSLIQFILRRTDATDFNITISKFNFTSIVGLTLPITNNSLALDFDLRGLNSTINGCYVWIRTLNITKARNAYLNISLYIANGTMARTAENLDFSGIEVKPNIILDSKIYYYNDYHGDKLTYFSFDKVKTDNLTRYNYFVVIKSNRSESGIFSLLTIPAVYPSGDNEPREHQIQILNDDGTWRAIISFDSDYPGATDLELDASEFKLNVTRGYMPSDFKINNAKTLLIQNLTVENYIISGLSTNSPNLEWGLGRWNYTLNSTLLCNPSKKFIISLTWNNTYIKGFKFNVNYTTEIFRSDNCTVYYHVNYDRLPEWTFNYTLNLNDIIFNHWNFTRLWYVYRNYFTAHNLTIPPDGSEVFNRIKGESLYSDLGYKFISVNSSIAKYSGKYSLNLTSPNAIYNEHSYINFKGILWETSGFMYGDNISVSVEIQFPSGYAPKINNGIANVTLHYPNGTALPGAKLISSNGRISDDGTKLIYDFDNQTILNITKSIKLGNNFPENEEDTYFLRFFWTNRSMAGCTSVPAYIDSYDIDLTNCTYDRNDGYNLLEGRQIHKVLNSYDLLIASINETTGINKPNFFPINTSINSNEGTFTYIIDNNPYNPIQVHMKNFLQNETILNPNEVVRFKVIVDNICDFGPVNVNISVKLVSLANEKWIIAQDISDSQTLGRNGDGDEVKEFTLDLKIPNMSPDSIWYGYNAPIRQSGAYAIVTVFIQNKEVGNYISRNCSLVVNKTDDLFEGYIIASYSATGAASYLKRFERHQCVYLPNKTTFMVNVYDDNYVSSYNQFIKQFNLTLDSDFVNTTIDPENIYNGQRFTISSILTTEFEVPIKNEDVYCQYYHAGNWINISNNPIKSNSNGSISFEINTLNLNIGSSLTVRLIWFGDTYILARSKEIPIDLNFQNNGISMQSDDDESLVFRNKINYFKLNFKNTGNSVLQITDIVVSIDDKDIEDYELINVDEYLLSRFEPGENFDVIIEIDIGDIDGSSLEIYVTINAVNILSNEPLSRQTTFNVKVLDKPLTDYVIEYSTFVILAIIVIGFLLVYIFVKRTNKKIELLIEEKVEERPKVSRYVKVSELKPEKIEEKEEEKLEKIDISEKAKEPKEKKELEENISKEMIAEEKLKEKAIEPVKLESVEKMDLEISPVEKVPEKIEEEKISLKREKKLPKKVKSKEKKQMEEVEKKPLSTKELVRLKKAEKRKGLFKKGGKKPKKLPKKVQVKKAKKKTTTDFDDLLKEKGLND